MTVISLIPVVSGWPIRAADVVLSCRCSSVCPDTMPVFDDDLRGVSPHPGEHERVALWLLKGERGSVRGSAGWVAQCGPGTALEDVMAANIGSRGDVLSVRGIPFRSWVDCARPYNGYGTTTA